MSDTPTIPVPPVTVPLLPDMWLARRFGLSPATARIIAELAFAPPAAWTERRA